MDDDAIDWDLSRSLVESDVPPATLVEIYSKRDTVEESSISEDSLNITDNGASTPFSCKSELELSLSSYSSSSYIPDRTEYSSRLSDNGVVCDSWTPVGLEAYPAYGLIRKSKLFDQLDVDINIHILDTGKVDTFMSNVTVEKEKIPELIDPIVSIVLKTAEHFVRDHKGQTMTTDYKRKVHALVDDIVDDVIERGKLTAFLWGIPELSDDFEGCSFRKTSECLTESPPSCDSPTCEEQWRKIMQMIPQIQTVPQDTPICLYFDDPSMQGMFEPCSKTFEICDRRRYADTFTEHMGKDIIEDFVSCWRLPKTWHLSTYPKGRSEDEECNYFKYNVACSKPTNTNPVPRGIVNINMTLSVFKVWPPDVPYEISYTIEGSSSVRTQNVREEWLDDVLIEKENIRRISEPIRCMDLN